MVINFDDSGDDGAEYVCDDDNRVDDNYDDTY
jgi:hypothetical protein